MSKSSTYSRDQYRPGFWALMATQAQGAFSDNVFKFLLIFFLVKYGGFVTATVTEEEAASTITSMATFLFSLPFILLPGIAGALADRYSKRKVMIGVKVFEIGIMALGGLALLAHNPAFLWVLLVLMAVHSTFFGPCKYGILPEMLPEEKLSWGNGMVQMATMVAVIAGTGLAGPLFHWLDGMDSVHYASVILVALAVGGTFSARGISRVAAANPSQPIPLNPYYGMLPHIRAFMADRWLFLTVIGYVYFWFVAALLNMNILVYGESLHLDETQTSIMLAFIGLGIGSGAAATGYLSRGKIEVGLIPLGALGMTVFSGLLALDLFNFQGSLVLLLGLGFFGGMFDVPLASTLQHRAPEKMRGGIMATANMLTFVGMAVASMLFYGLGQLGVSPRGIFLLTAVMTFVMGIYICFTIPVFVVRLGLWFLGNTLYRLRIINRHHVPEQGGGLLVSNHSSFLDALVVLAAIDRPVRFLMYQPIYEVPWIKPLAKMMGAIPVMPGGGPREVVNSLRTATEAIRNGDLVCIFAEGQITRTGQMLPFRRGFEKIMKGLDAPIIPVFIDQVWGSVFSFAGGRFFWKWPRRFPFPITIGFGGPMPSTTSAYELRQSIQQVGTEAYATRKMRAELLHRAFIQQARRHPRMLCVADGRSGALPYWKTLAGAIVLAQKLKPLLGPEEMVGVLLPQSVGGALVNIALPLMGKVPVNLNYTGSNDALMAAARQCGMKQIVTARAFLEQVPVQPPGETLFVDDILPTVTPRDRIKALLIGLFMPVKRIERMLGAPANRTRDELATVIFSSGSEGEPKGIMLTHFNVMSNIEAAIQVFPHKKGDVIVGMLPFFHSFGYTGTLWVVLTQKLSGVYHPNPLDARAIGELIQKYKGKILFSTSTFLHGFIRRCSAAQLSTLEHIVTGAEKLSPRVRDAFKEKFGAEPLEGYGTTECAPIVSLNLPDFRAPGLYQRGLKRGSIGHPLPGISVKIIDPDTREILQNGDAGLLLVKGPNVMKGYLGNPDKTAEVLRDGWYETGDMATIDEDGFITITDRLSRFSKIGGEMISHTIVEESLLKLLDESERVLAVAGVPDEHKGERLVVLHTMSDDRFDELLGKLDETGLPNLWVPKAKAFYKVDAIPLLGTGKMDLKAVKTLARQLDIGE